MVNGEIVTHILMVIVMAFLYAYSYTFPRLDIGGKLGPGFWPRLVLGIGIVLTVYSGYRAYAAARGALRTGDGNAGRERGAVKGENETRSLVRFGTAAAVFGVFVIAVQRLGFLVATPFLVGFYMWQLGVRRAWVLAMGSVIITLVFVLLFGRLLYVALPRGTGVMRLLSYYFY